MALGQLRELGVVPQESPVPTARQPIPDYVPPSPEPTP